MIENQFNKSNMKQSNHPNTIHRDNRPKSSKAKINDKNIFKAVKLPYQKFEQLRYSGKLFNKNETKLAKFLLSNDFKLHNFYKEKNKENENDKILIDDKNKIKELEEQINQQKKLIEEKKNKIKNMNENNNKIKESIKEKENNINNIKKSINDFKKLNDELITKINDLKENNNNNNNNDVNDSNLDNSNYLDINFENSREREEAINYLLSMMANLPPPQQQYPNVDNMTYEELLELEDKIGKVDNGLNEEEIKHLKQEKFIKYKYLEDKCIICQYDFKELETIVVLLCNHCFHFPCIKPWIVKQHYCPLCKTDIRIQDK